MEMVDGNNRIVGSTTRSNYYVGILSTINRELLKPSASVALHRHSNALVDVLPLEADSSISLLSQSEKPDVTYNIHLVVSCSTVLLVFGKTIFAKVIANHTTAEFIRVVGSEFVQKYLGEDPCMVCDVFRLAKENAPAIIFIDEVDAIATARFDAQIGADREVQRILMELLNQMDGFDHYIIILIQLSEMVCMSKMNLGDEVDLEDYVSTDKISLLEVIVILPKDFEKGYRANVKKPDT
ncbi:hypothetical protein K2173_026951 [Erythroxylum novogranatense]|uniref:ATPase AAA-type core domain-containing protein n=1 Tax=Erythroxylum novogranatense TaxID=1862640 RepID=A0AAV8U0L5_9ROSI|nr:hypothetical protein K2173_026951 [Erythroxylum novogranatense]